MDARGLGAHLRGLREAATLTREALAERCGVSARTIASLELGTVARPRISTLGALADGLALDDAGRADLISLARGESTSGTPAAGPATVPHELPPDVADLVGRERVRADASSWFCTHVGPAAVWAIAGPPGVGKSTTAIQVAHEVAPDYPDGQVYVHLGAGADPSSPDLAVVALRRVLAAIGVHPALMPVDLDGLAAMMRTELAHRRVLIVLDDAPGESDLTPLLPASPGSAVIVTSRVPPASLVSARLDLLGELDLDGAVRMLTGLAGQDRVAADPASALAVVELCGRLPVALRVIGARLAARPSMSLAEAAAFLADERSRVDLLTVGDLGVRTSLGSAYEALAPRERRTLRVLGDLGVGEGPTWSVAAALGMTHADAVVSLERLAAAGLVETASAGAAHRYRLHDLTRLLARERSEETDDAGERGERLARVFDRVRYLADEVASRLPIVRDGISEGLPAAGEPPAREDVDLLLVAPHALVDATVRMLPGWIRAAHGLVPPSRQWQVAVMLWRQARTADVYDIDERALMDLAHDCAAAGDRRGEAVLLTYLALDVYRRRPREVVLEELARATQTFQTLEDRTGRALAMSMTALHLAETAQTQAQALTVARAAVDVVGEAGDAHVVGDAIAQMLRVALGQNGTQVEAAAAALELARELVRQPPSRQWQAQIDWAHGHVARAQGRYVEAGAALERARAFVVETGDRWGQCSICADIADVLTDTHRLEEALAELRTGHALALQIAHTGFRRHFEARIEQLEAEDASLTH